MLRISPSPDNDYLVVFGDGKWVNPCAQQIAQNFSLPPNNSELIDLFKTKYGQAKDFRFPETAPFLLGRIMEIFIKICAHAECNDVITLSQVNTYCYIAIQSDLLWEMQFTKTFPGATGSLSQKFTRKQQLQLIFNAIKKRQKPFKVQLEYYAERVEKALKSFKNAIGITESSLLALSLMDYLGNTPFGKYPKAIDPASKMGKCITALELIPKMEFNTQDALKKIIQQAEMIELVTTFPPHFCLDEGQTVPHLLANF